MARVWRSKFTIISTRKVLRSMGDGDFWGEGAIGPQVPIPPL
ncbi:hypothetical protein [Microcoleus vaginatus]